MYSRSAEMKTTKVNLCVKCEMSAYAPLGTHKAVILRYCYTCTQLHVHTHMCVCVNETDRQTESDSEHEMLAACQNSKKESPHTHCFTRSPFSWDVVLHHWVSGAQSFATM